MKRKFTTLALAIPLFLGTTAFIVKYSTGIAGYTGSPGEGTCTSCHGGGSSATSSVSILSTPAFSVNQFVPGTTYTITINVAASGFTKFGFDCEVLDEQNASIGTMQNQGAGVYFQTYGFSKKNAVHNAPKTGQGNANFSFVWVAPTVGDSAIIYASGNAVNGDGNTTGDFPLQASVLKLSAHQASQDSLDVGINELKKASVIPVSVYPNPAVDLTTISYALDQAQQVSVQLIDVYGKTTKEFINERETAGSHAHLLDLQGIAPGIYFVKLSGNGNRMFQQMLVVK